MVGKPKILPVLTSWFCPMLYQGKHLTISFLIYTHFQFKVYRDWINTCSSHIKNLKVLFFVHASDEQAVKEARSTEEKRASIGGQT